MLISIRSFAGTSPMCRQAASGGGRRLGSKSLYERLTMMRLPGEWAQCPYSSNELRRLPSPRGDSGAFGRRRRKKRIAAALRQLITPSYGDDPLVGEDGGNTVAQCRRRLHPFE